MNTLRLKTMATVLLLLSFWACKERAPVVEVVDKVIMANELVGTEVKVVDVRTAKEFSEGHIEGAINLDVKNEAQFIAQIEQWNKKDSICVYCARGKRSARATELLQAYGFKTIFDYSGGYTDWINDQ